MLLSDSRENPIKFNPRVNVGRYTLTGFSIPETKLYLQDCQTNENFLTEICVLCRNSPGRLASVRRLLMAGTTTASLTNRIHLTFSNLFELEWKSVRQEDQIQERLLAVLAYGHELFGLKEIASIIGLIPSKFAQK